MSMNGRPPYNPDFDVLSEAVTQADQLAEAGRVPVEEIIGQLSDPETVFYFAHQRAVVRLLAASGIQPTERIKAALVTAWIDGMMAGHKLGEAHKEAETK